MWPQLHSWTTSETWALQLYWLYSALNTRSKTSRLTNYRLKCDRNQPCQNCTKRDLASSCTFIHAGLRDKSLASVHKSSTGSHDIHGRIRLLEELVVSFMHKTAEKLPRDAPTSIQTLPQADNASRHDTFEDDLGISPDSLGRICIDDEHPNYVGAIHWSAILDSVSGLAVFHLPYYQTKLTIWHYRLQVLEIHWRTPKMHRPQKKLTYLLLLDQNCL